MNRIFKVYMLVAITLIASCTELEEEPVGQLAPATFFTTLRDVETAVLGGYGLIASEQYYGRKLTTTLILRGDMGDIGNPGTPARRIDVNNFTMDDNNGMILSFWPRMYEVIGAANAAVAGAQQVRVTADLLEEEARELDALEAEAKFIRAFTYYHLVRIFGDIPYVDDYFDEPEEIEASFTIGKTPQAEVYANIIADLEEGAAALPDVPVARSRPGKGTALSYLASVHLTLGNYQEAYAAARQVIEQRDAFEYGLSDDYQLLFDATVSASQNESIFHIDFLGAVLGGSGINTDWFGTMTGVRGGNPNGWGVIVPNFNVFEQWDERDYRKAVSMSDSFLLSAQNEILPYDSFPQEKRPHIAKYNRFCGNSTNNCGQSDHNYHAMRYAEVLLTAAEALNEINGPTAEALGYVNEVRARARNTPTGMNEFPFDVEGGISQDAFRELVLEERRLELSFEFGRWYDIKRRQIGPEVFAADGLEPHDNFNPERDYLMPLPGDELTQNPNLGPQNFGY
ncbi:RagB/SusD family nutrient uptake outer membrane protein [Tunicatimonas pelagia]|uniref:RagB/SusD family nutrient uptake outer membrane protein n=1 Tax=Tunicatimonas pelagia TaxID=931531 RepID=UPI002665EE81|nr:RagB/SusD family nutrient uptake outer membrane protein [Tunicatimonas pelagia]WKN44952.1 RagB/SusD family nutrient uptake outer membrane protein [Tunicatimonas pelagia]